MTSVLKRRDEDRQTRREDQMKAQGEEAERGLRRH